MTAFRTFFALAALSTAAAAQTRSIATVRIGDKPGLKIPASFLGFSHEWNGVPALMGDSRIGVNVVYRQLLANLESFGSGPLVIRIGGNSTDKTKEPMPTSALPFAEVNKALGIHFILGVNMADNNPRLAAQQAAAYIKQMPPGSIDAIEVGNEPHLFAKNHYRPDSYSPADYFNEFDRFKAAIMPVLPPAIKLTGPAWGYQGKTWGALPDSIDDFVKREGPVLSMITYHDYTSHPTANPPEDWLLKERPSSRGPIAVAPIAAMAHQHGLLFRMGEMNSISNGGVRGISDAFGSALWALDINFEFASRGTDGVNWITGNGNAYSSFYFDTKKSGDTQNYSLLSVSPVYYGLLLFQQAVGASAKGTHLLPIDLKTDANLKAWATLDGTGTERLVLINKDEDSSGLVTVTAPAGSSTATVLRLTAPSFKATTSGLALGGQTFEGSHDGKLQGTRKTETFTATKGMFQIPMPVTSAALITFSK